MSLEGMSTWTESDPVTRAGIKDARDWADNGNDPGNPRQWPLWQKISTSAIVGSLAFVITFAGSIYAPAQEVVAAEFRTSSTVALLPLALYNLGLAFGPIIGGPLSERLGRKVVYQSTTPLFALFVLGSGFSDNIIALTVCRFFSGVFGSPGISFAAATIGDMVALPDRAPYMAMYYTQPWLGAVMGPLLGGFVVVGKGWRWTQWTALFFTTASLLSTVTLKESYKHRILSDRSKKLKIEGPSRVERTLGQEIRHFATTTVTRPVHMLCTEPIVSCFCLYASFDFGVLYTFVVASPATFAKVYGFNLEQQGLSFLGFITGACLGTIPIILIDKFVYQPGLSDVPGIQSRSAPERRLYVAMLGSVLFPIGLWWYGWTMRDDIHWICPIAAQGVALAGALEVYVAANLYLMDTYGPLYGASTQAANSLTRYAVSTATPLFALQMFDGLGIAWAASLLGFFAIALAPIPWVLYRYGNTIRAKSRYPAGD